MTEWQLNLYKTNEDWRNSYQLRLLRFVLNKNRIRLDRYRTLINQQEGY